MHLQEQPIIKPQPIRMSLNAPPDKVYKLATELHRDTAAREAFQQSPADFLGSRGLEIDGAFPLSFADRKGDPEEGDLDPEVAAIAVCFVATNVGIGGVVVCGVALVTDEPMDTIDGGTVE